MIAPPDAEKLLEEVRQGHVSKRFHEVYCERATAAAAGMTGLTKTFATHLLGGLAGMIRRSTTPLSREELQRDVKKMDEDKRERFGKLVLGLD